jgi:hypothetical protein
MFSRFGISGSALQWFRSYLTGHTQFVGVNGSFSSSVSLHFGVSQVFVCGPILFIIYNSPFHNIPTTRGISDHGYANDEQFYISFRPSTDGVPQNSAFSSMSCISEFKLWAADNKLKFNDCKTDALLITSSFLKKKPTPSALAVGDHLIKISEAVHNLGLFMDTYLTMDPHIKQSCKKAFYHLSRIAPINKHLKPAALKLLVHSFVMSQLDYGNSLLAGFTNGRMERLQRVQNCAARLITGTRRCDSITPHLKSLHWLPIKLRIDFKIALLCYLSLNSCASLYLYNLLQLQRPNSSVSLRSSSAQKLAVPSSRTKTNGDRAFSVYAAKFWNHLPSTICSSPSSRIV